MEPLPIRLVEIGKSTGINVPATVVRLFKWEAGMIMRARLVSRGRLFECTLSPTYRKDGLRIIVPVPVLESYGLALGDMVDVPFDAWKDTGQRVKTLSPPKVSVKQKAAQKDQNSALKRAESGR